MQDYSKLASGISRGAQLAETSIGIKANQSLLEAKGWKEIVSDIKDDQKRATTAMLLENYKNWRNSLDEATSTIQVGTFDKFAFPILTIVSENLVAQDLVSLQPLEGPSGQVFYMNFTTGQGKGADARGSKVWDARTGHVDRSSDSDSYISGEALGTVASGDLSATLSYSPVLPGTVSIEDADGNTYTDDGNSVITNSAGATVGVVNYNTGALTLGSSGGYTDLSANGSAQATYSYNAELNPDAQQMDFEIVSALVQTKERKLRGRWSMEAAAALEALHKVNAENTISNAIANNLQWEKDREVIEDLRRIATGGLVSWSATPPTNVSYTEHKLTFVDAVVSASNMIQRSTNRVKANWLLMGIQPSGVVETLPMFDGSSVEKAEIEGVSELGKLGRVKCFTDPHYRSDEALVGYKGKDWARTGYILAEWLPLITTPPTTLDDFLTRKGFATVYGKKVVNSRMYATIQCSGFSASFGA